MVNSYSFVESAFSFSPGKISFVVGLYVHPLTLEETIELWFLTLDTFEDVHQCPILVVKMLPLVSNKILYLV